MNIKQLFRSELQSLATLVGGKSFLYAAPLCVCKTRGLKPQKLLTTCSPLKIKLAPVWGGMVHILNP